MDRRDFVAAASGLGAVGLAGCTGGGKTDEEPPNANIIVGDQLTDGRSITIEALETDAATSLVIRNEAGDEVARSEVEANESGTDWTVEIDDALDVSQEITVQLVHEEHGVIGESTAFVDVADLDGVGATVERGEFVEVEAAPEFGFNYPYFLYLPPDLGTDGGPIVVEPNNTGTTTDSFDKHREMARRIVEFPTNIGRRISDTLDVPLLVPIFPRPEEDPVDWRHYVNALDEETMAIEGGKLARVDRQLLRMVDHAGSQLADRSYPIDEQFLMDGFSASGNFVNRFAALHPDRVRSVTAGAVNGTAILPLEEAKGHTLPYPIGVADVESIIGTPFDEDAWTDVAQFVYMGNEDDNDTIPYEDAWSDEQRNIALDVYGPDMQEDRMPYCESVYEKAGASAQFHLYAGVEHSYTRTITDDCVAFHRRNMDRDAGFDPIEAGESPAARIELSVAEQPEAGDTTVVVDVFVPENMKLYSDEMKLDVYRGTEARYNQSIERAMRGKQGIFAGTDDTFTVELATRKAGVPLEAGEPITIGLIDQTKVETITVDVE